MTPLETLKAARELISDPARWTSHVNARTVKGRQCGIWDEQAICWCLIGAVYKHNRGCYCNGVVDKLNLLSRKMFNGLSASASNDEHGHSAALAILDAAIEELS